MEENSGLSLWDAVPEECKSLILSRLSNRDAARIARVSKEFDEVVKKIRDSVQLLVLPPDLSPAALQGFVASHKNLKHLSFKRCSAKIKRFMPIIEAAAGGKLHSKWYHRRSLTSVDFRSCGFLTDGDVNALCVLHVKLEDVNLANCCGISDIALSVLARYQQASIASSDSTPEGSAASPTKWLDDTEESSMPVIQGPATIREEPDSFEPGNFEPGNFEPDTFWPELIAHAQFKLSSNADTEDVTWGSQSSQSVDLPHTSEASDSASVDVGQSSITTEPIPPRSYAQVALNATDSSPLTVFPNSFRNNVDVSSSINADTKNFVDTVGLGGLAHIDWTSVMIPSSTVDPSYSGSNDTHLQFNRTPTSGKGLVVEDPKQDRLIFFPTRKKRGNKDISVDVNNSLTEHPERMGALQLDTAIKEHFLKRDDLRLPTSRRLGKAVVDAHGKGTNIYSLDFESSGDKRLATRSSLHIPDPRASTSEAEFNKLVQDFKVSKVVRVGGAKQVTDQRLEMPSRKSTKDRVEAVRTTHSDVDLFFISREDCASIEPFLPGGYKRNERIGSLDESFPLPAGSKHLQVGTVCKDCKSIHGKHTYPVTPWFNDMGDEQHWKTRGLRSVSVAGCSEITDTGVQALLRGPSKESLVSLDISRCSGVTSAGLRFPPISALEVLTAAQLPNIPRLFMQLSSEGSLRHLSLAASPKLDDLHLVAPYLQTLNVSNCKKLIRLQLKCPELLSCNLSLCESLETISRFTCGSLQRVNVYGCRLLRPAGFSCILDTAVSLQELRCGGCDRLERLFIPQMSLVRLEVQGCSSLRRLNVQSHLLKSVDGCGCKNLTEVYLFSANLRRMLFTNCALLQTLVMPLDAMKQSVDLAVLNRDQDSQVPQEGLEISISGCNVSDSVQKNLARLSKQWKSTFSN